MRGADFSQNLKLNSYVDMLFVPHCGAGAVVREIRAGSFVDGEELCEVRGLKLNLRVFVPLW